MKDTSLIDVVLGVFLFMVLYHLCFGGITIKFNDNNYFIDINCGGE